MAQYDVHPIDGGALVVDCQADTLSHLESRVVIPLLRRDEAPPATDFLHPILNVSGQTLVLATQLMTAVRKSELGRPVASLADARYAIVRATDLLLTGS
ncbi:CcdB family protein [Sphingomonas sp. KR3-1]|uniref:CcdB family protein n=1 Tax=Sphingomonas sp. KR3-1 TaxID=3156611 RepID=UPI0032B335B4